MYLLVVIYTQLESAFRAVAWPQIPCASTATTEYCVPGPLRRLSSAGTTQNFSPASVGVSEGLAVSVEVGSGACVAVGVSVGVAVAVAVGAALHAVNKTIQRLASKIDFIFTHP